MRQLNVLGCHVGTMCAQLVCSLRSVGRDQLSTLSDRLRSSVICSQTSPIVLTCSSADILVETPATMVEHSS